MENTLTNYAKAGIEVKRFTYMRNGNLTAVKPSKNEKLYLVEDYFGNKSMIWVACSENGAEKWRHNISSIIRLTFEQAIVNLI